MIRRNAELTLRNLAQTSPVVTVMGPRQSGKTTLCKAVFPTKPYYSLETPDTRERVRSDPRGFLRAIADGAILDEIQALPEFLSYLQSEVDERPIHGRFILSGSQQLGLGAAVSQSLAGRTSLLQLMPLTLDETQQFALTPNETSLWPIIWQGGYPRIRNESLDPMKWLGDYVMTYVQRDVRQLINIANLDTFTAFVRLCAGRTGQELQLASLGADAGVSQPTARAWLSALEAAFLVFRAPAWFRNTNKRVVKSPKLHFLDTGLVCYLLGIHQPNDLKHHPLRGAIFESWVASEVYKSRCNLALPPNLFHLREARGIELDLIVEGASVHAVECKSGATIGSDFLRHVRAALAPAFFGDHRPTQAHLIYGGETHDTISDVDICPWHTVPTRDWH